MIFLGLPFTANAVSEPIDKRSLVPAPTNMEGMRDFVEAARTEAVELGFLILRNEAKIEGRWKNNTVYLLLLEPDGHVTFHADDRSLEDRDLSSDPLVMKVLANPGKCIEYEDHEGITGRYACSVEVLTGEIFKEGIRTTPKTQLLIAGLHTAPKPEEPFENILGSGYMPEVTAGDVKDAETLKLFVDGALEAALIHNFGVSRAETPNLIRFRPLLRKEGGPWNQGDIYLYIMLENLVLFNGNSPDLEDTTLNITDRNGCNVGEEIHRVIAGEDRECKSLGLLPQNSEGYLEYLWDNPDIEGDEDERFLDSQEFSPGFTPKLGYVKSFRTRTGVNVIMGSGVYPVVEEKPDNDGCALAGSSENLPAGLLALFLLVGIIGFRKN